MKSRSSADSVRGSDSLRGSDSVRGSHLRIVILSGAKDLQLPALDWSWQEGCHLLKLSSRAERRSRVVEGPAVRCTAERSSTASRPQVPPLRRAKTAHLRSG